LLIKGYDNTEKGGIKRDYGLLYFYHVDFSGSSGLRNGLDPTAPEREPKQGEFEKLRREPGEVANEGGGSVRCHRLSGYVSSGQGPVNTRHRFKFNAAL
jgi:hypothetical protein